MVQYTLGKEKLNKIIDATVYERDRGRERERENTKESHKGGKQVNIEQSAVRDDHGKEIGGTVVNEFWMLFSGGAEATETLLLARLEPRCSSG